MLTGHESWVPDELAYAGRENRDPAHAAKYDTKMDAEASQEVSLLRDLGIGAGSTVLDLGAGTGQFSLAASSAFERVIAVDVSPVMLSRLEARLVSLDIHNVDCKLAGFLTYIHEGPLVDAVYSRFALHHLPDFWQALALTRMASFLRPGGILRLWDVVYGFEPAEAPERLEQWMANNASDEEGGWARPEFEEHIRDENSTFTWLLEPMLERAGFTIQTTEYSADQVFAQYVCVKAAG